MRPSVIFSDKRYTADDLWRLSGQPDYDEKFLELIDGEIVLLQPVYFKPGVVTTSLSFHLLSYVERTSLNFWAVMGAGFQLSITDVLGPDIALVSREGHPVLTKRWFMGAPDLAIEVLPVPEDLAYLQRKARKYLEYGTKLVWIMYPDDETADVCRLTESGSLLIDEVGKDGTLDAGDALPGFTLALRDVFRN
jgi:Uma2 family endonuclease